MSDQIPPALEGYIHRLWDLVDLAESADPGCEDVIAEIDRLSREDVNALLLLAVAGLIGARDART